MDASVTILGKPPKCAWRDFNFKAEKLFKVICRFHAIKLSRDNSCLYYLSNILLYCFLC